MISIASDYFEKKSDYWQPARDVKMTLLRPRNNVQTTSFLLYTGKRTNGNSVNIYHNFLPQNNKLKERIRHSKYSAMLLKIHSYSYCFFGDFSHWVDFLM